MRLTETVALVASGEMRLTDQYDCNVYLIDAPDGPIIVDTGSGRATDRILDRCRSSFGEPEAALLTHAHADHSQGAPDLQEAGIEVIGPEATEPLVAAGTDEELGLRAAKRDDAYPPDYEFTHFEPDGTVTSGSTTTVLGREFEVVSIRGHARDHVCYLTHGDGRRACFIGDAISSDGEISLLNVAGSSLADYRADIGNLADREIDALFPGHGLPRLREGQAAIDIAAEALRGMFTPPSRT